MRRLIPILVVLAAIPVVLFLVWDTQTRSLGNALLAEFTTLKQRSFSREPRPRAPLHENGYQCVASMLDVTTADFGPFSPKNATALDLFVTGQRPVSEVPPDVRAFMLTFSPWAVSMRGCGDSARLAWVDGLSPWASPTHARWVRLSDAIPSLIEFTALELRVLIADAQPEVALERCSATWAMVADQSHLGQLGAMNARMAVRRLAPACGEALAAVPPEVRTQLAKQWAPLKSRLASPKEVIEAERIGTSLRTFAWVTDEAIRSQLPAVTVPSGSDFRSRVRVARTWRAWDEAMRELAATADAPGAARVSASERVDGVVPSQHEKFLSAYEEAGVLLDLLADLAAGGAKPLPAGVTRSEKGLEYSSPQAQTLLIPTSK